VRLAAIGLAVVLLAAPLAAEAQPTAHRVGLLAQDLQPGLLETLQDQLQRQGYVEGRNITLEVRNAAGRSNLLPSLVEELLRLKVEVIVAVNTPAAKAARKATATVPIVIMRVADPVGQGLVASLAHPGGNVTGLSFMPDVLGAKGLEVLHEILPAIIRVAALYKADNPGALLVCRLHPK
jgi:putative ABC transport system substrate-binding protein